MLRRILFSSVLSVLLFSCAHGARSEKAAELPDPKLYEQFVIIGTNDFHGFMRTVESDVFGEKALIGGAEWFAGHMRILQKKYGEHLIMLDGGDLFQGTMESNTFLGKPVIEYYNLLPYRAAAVGNHEFDYGPLVRGSPDRIGALKQRMSEAEFPFLSANIFLKGSHKNWKEKNLYPHTMFMVGDYHIGVLGLTTETTPAKTLPQNVQKLSFEDITTNAIREAKLLREQGADLVFITMHEGGDEPGEPVYEMIRKFPKGLVDAVVTGHSHTEIHKFIYGIPVIQSKARGLYFGRIDLFVNKKTKRVDTRYTHIHDIHMICGNWFANADHCDQKKMKDKVANWEAKAKELVPLRPAAYEGEPVKPDQEVLRVLKPYYEQVDKKKKELLAHAAKDFDYMPSGESDMGTLFADALRWRFPYAKVYYANGGGIRRRFYRGEIRYGDLYEVYPFDNLSVAVKLTGAQFKDLVRVGVSGSQSIPVVSGVDVVYDRSFSDEQLRDVNGDGKKQNWERDRLLSLSWSDTGKPVRDDETFWVATNDYLVQGGDNTDQVFSKVAAKDKRYLEESQRDTVALYLRKHKGLSLPRAEREHIHTK